MPLNAAGRLLRGDGGSRSYLASDIEYRQELYDRTHGPLRTPRPSARSFSFRSATSQVCSLGALAMIGGLAVLCFLSYQMTLGMLQGGAMGMNRFIVEALQNQSGTLTKLFQRHSEASATVQALSTRQQGGHAIISNETYCSPTAVNVTQLRNESQFYTMLSESSILPPPVFSSSQKILCGNAEASRQYQWEYCLPVSANRTDQQHCQGADRLDLLGSQQPGESLCAASVLHLLLVDAYTVLHTSGAKPVLLGGLLLGAMQNGSMIPTAKTVELGFQSHLVATDELGHKLSARGYHLFFDSMWRVCISPTHPLASRLHRADQQQPTTTATASTLHVDLFRMEPLATTGPLGAGGSQWYVENIESRRVVQVNELLPYQQVTVNGIKFDSVADVAAFLTNSN